MRIKGGEEYQGAVRADPHQTRAEREEELLALLKTAADHEVIEHCFAKHTGKAPRDCPPAGLLMIQTILDREYPRS